MSAESFTLRIVPLGEQGYEAHVQSPAGEVTAPCNLSGVAWMLQISAEVIPADPDDWRARGFDLALARISSTQEGSPQWDPLAIGQALYRGVFNTRVQRLLDESRGLARRADRVLPIEFRFEVENPHEARLATLPWELLSDPQTGHYLAQSEETPITRYLAFEGRVRRYQAPAVLRILVVASSPAGLPQLEWEKELGILEGLPQANIIIDRLKQPTRRALRAAVRRGFHVLHFLGHGTVDRGTGEGLLALTDHRGEIDWVPGQELARWVRNSRSLRLVVLNACDTAVDKGPQPFVGVASALVRGGVAATLAMRRPIPEGRALDFARVLYGRLSEGRPLDAALSSARQELAILDPGRHHWATPTLYSHTHEVFHVPVNLRESLTKVFSWLGVVTANISANAYMGSQDGPELPGFQFYEVHEQSVPIFGVLFVAPLLIGLLLVVLRYQMNAPDRGLFHRLPIAFGVPIGDRRNLARTYQTIMLLVFLVLPVLSQIFFMDQVLSGEIRRKYSTEEWIKGAKEQLTTVVPLTLDDAYYFGPEKELKEGQDPNAKRPKLLANSDCREKILRVCHVTYFPFWQPWLFLLAEFFIFALFAAALWGIWAREPLSQVIGRGVRRMQHLALPSP